MNMSTYTIKFISTIHKKYMFMVNEYEFMYSKKKFRKRDSTNVYYYILLLDLCQKCGATFRAIIKNHEHNIKDESCILAKVGNS